MLGPVRTAISVAFIAGLVWFSFSVKLGDKTLAQHVDRISETSEAKDLAEGARDRLNPTLEDAKQRILGEYIEAPTQESLSPGAQRSDLPAKTLEAKRPAMGDRRASEPRLPGRG